MDSTAPGAEPPTRFPSIAIGSVVGLLAVVFGVFVYHAVRVVAFPGDLDNGEGFLLAQAVGWSRGISPYRSVAVEPYLVANYPPLYAWLVSVPLRWGEVSFVWGRSISLLATLGTGLCLAAITRRIGGRPAAAALAGLLWFSSPYVYEWAAFHRVDPLATFLTVAGLTAWMAGRRVVVAGILFALALLTRQTTFLAPLAVVIHLVARGERRRAGVLAAVAFGIPLLVGGVLQWQSDGELFRHVVTYNVNRFDWRSVHFFAKQVLSLHPVLFGLGLWALGRRLRETRADLPAVWAASTLLAFLLCGKVGAASNYFLETIAAFCVLMGWCVSRACASAATGAREPGLPVAAIAGLLLVQALVSIQIPGYDEFAPTPRAADRARATELVAAIRDTPGPCLAEDSGYLLLAGKEVLLQPFIMSRLAEDGVWDQRPLVRDLEARRFSLVILGFDAMQGTSIRFTQPMLHAIRRNYRLLGRVAGPGGGDADEPSPWWNYRVYRP